MLSSSSLPQGYDTVVGERGLKFSGGEKQRVAIARVLLKNPPILVFDEATSSLDSQSEKNILGAFEENFSHNKTTLVIAHRLSTVIDADRIIVLEQGRIREQGSHETLIDADGLYAGLWRMQQKKAEEILMDDRNCPLQRQRTFRVARAWVTIWRRSSRMVISSWSIPAGAWTSGCFVIARIGGQAILRQLFIDAGIYRLAALKQGLPTQAIEGGRRQSSASSASVPAAAAENTSVTISDSVSSRFWTE